MRQDGRFTDHVRIRSMSSHLGSAVPAMLPCSLREGFRDCWVVPGDVFGWWGHGYRNVRPAQQSRPTTAASSGHGTSGQRVLQGLSLTSCHFLPRSTVRFTMSSSSRRRRGRKNRAPNRIN